MSNGYGGCSCFLLLGISMVIWPSCWEIQGTKRLVLHFFPIQNTLMSYLLQVILLPNISWDRAAFDGSQFPRVGDLNCQRGKNTIETLQIQGDLVIYDSHVYSISSWFSLEVWFCNPVSMVASCWFTDSRKIDQPKGRTLEWSSQRIRKKSTTCGKIPSGNLT